MKSLYGTVVFIFLCTILTACQSGYDEVRPAKNEVLIDDDQRQEPDSDVLSDADAHNEAVIAKSGSDLNLMDCFSPAYHKRLTELEGKIFASKPLNRAQIDEMLDGISSGDISLRGDSYWEGISPEHQIIFFFREYLDSGSRGGIRALESFDISKQFSKDENLSYYHLTASPTSGILVHRDENSIYLFERSDESIRVSHVFQFREGCSLDDLQVLDGYTVHYEEIVVLSDDERLYLVNLESMEYVSDYGLNGWRVISSYTTYNVEERSDDYYLYLFHNEDNKLKKVLLNTSETLYEIDNPIGDGELHHVASGLHGKLYIGAKHDEAPVIYTAYENEGIVKVEPMSEEPIGRIKEIRNLNVLITGDDVEDLMIVSDHPDDVFRQIRFEWELTDLVALKVCMLEDIYGRDSSDIIEIIETNFQTMNPSSVAPSHHEVALIISQVGSCFRDETERIMADDQNLSDRVNALRTTALDLNEHDYEYNAHVNGGGSMHAAFSNSFPGILEIYLYHYVQEVLSGGYSTDDTEKFERIVTAIEDSLAEKKLTARQDGHATAIVDSLAADLDSLIELLSERTAAETNLLYHLSAKFLE